MKHWRELIWLIPGIAAVIISIILTNSSVPKIALDKKVLSNMDIALQSFHAAEPVVQTKAENKKRGHSAAAAAKKSEGTSENPSGAAENDKGSSGTAADDKGPSGAAAVTHDKSLKNAKYKDGTYTGSGRGFGGSTRLRVTVKKGKIKKLSLISHQDTPSYFSRARVLLKRIVQKQSTDVDAVSGATYSSRGIVQAVENALRKAASSKSSGKKTGSKAKKAAKKNKKHTSKSPSKTRKDKPTGPEKSSGLADGIFEGSGKGFGGKINVKITVKNGKITDIDVKGDKETPEFFKKAKDGILSEILKKQSPNVDSVSGATFSSKGIKDAVAQALEKSRQQAKKQQAQEETKSQTEETKTQTEKETKKQTEEETVKQETEETGETANEQ